MDQKREKRRPKKIISKLKSKYRLVIMNDDTYEEKFSFRLSPMNVFTFGGSSLILLIFLVISLVAFTSLREFIPGYADVDLRRNALKAVLKADSLEQELEVKQNFLTNLASIIDGRIGNEAVLSQKDCTSVYSGITIEKSAEDSILRAEIESGDKYALNSASSRSRKSINSYFFFPPISGIVSSRFASRTGHFGVDIVAKENEAVKATLNGTVIFAGWTSENGHVIQLQHENNIVSTYKHNSALLKKEGSYVKAGEAIAIVGNSGEQTTGPHLHFEVWYNGLPLDPEEYIVF